MVRSDNPSKPMHKNGQSWILYALTGNPEYVDKLMASLSAIVRRMERDHHHLSAQLKFAASLASEWIFTYEAFPEDYG
jgi:hypothetical protein